MATLLSHGGGGNFATAGTWKIAATGTNAENTTLSATIGSSTTTYRNSQAFTITNGEVLEGVAIHVNQATVNGTVTVGLSDDGGSTWAREVTCNVTDLPTAKSWVFFKFGTTLTADGGSDYIIGIKSSSASSTSGTSINTTAYNWAHVLRTDTAAGSLSAGDKFFVVDDVESAGTITANPIVMNNTATTDFGEINVGYGTMSYGTSASTNYYLKASGDVNIWGGGTLNIGTTGTPMPSTSTAVLELDPTSDGEFGLIVQLGGTLVAQGNPMTRVWDLLATNEAVNSTSWTTANSTGWKDNDQIVIASTSRTPTETELGALNGDASTTTLTVDGFGGAGGGLAYAHEGTDPFQAEIINLTRNVKIRSSSSTVMTYLYAATTSTVDLDYVEMYYFGENVANKRGIEIATTTGTFSMQYCSLHDTEDLAMYFVSASGSGIAVDNNVFYNVNTAKVANLRVFHILASTGVSSFTNNIILAAKCASVAVLHLLDSGLTCTGNRFAGCESGAAGIIFSVAETAGIPSNMSGNIIHSNEGVGVSILIPLGDYNEPTTFTGFKSWRNSLYGFSITPSFSASGYFTLASSYASGNTTANVLVQGSGVLLLDTCDIQGDATYATTQGIYNTAMMNNLYLKNCTIGTTTAHTSYGINGTGLVVYAYNTTIGDSVEVNNTGNVWNKVLSHKHDGSATTYKNWYYTGIIESDQTTRHTASGYSWKLTPLSATRGLILPGPTSFDTYKVAVNASSAVTITAQVYKDSSYNGDEPKLVLKGGFIGGIASDVTDTLTVAHSNWEELSVSGTPNEAGVVEYYIVCNGTAGSVYVDDITVSQA